MARRGGFLARVITVDKKHVGNREGRDEYARVVFIKEESGGIIPMVKRKGETIMGPVVHEDGVMKDKGKGYGSFFNENGSFNSEQASKTVNEFRAYIWMREQRRIEMTPLNFYHAGLPDGVNTDFKSAGIRTLYNTGEKDQAADFVKKIELLIEKNAERTSGFSRMLKREIEFYVDRVNQSTVSHIVEQINDVGKYSAELIDAYTLSFMDKTRPMSKPTQFHFVKGEW